MRIWAEGGNVLLEAKDISVNYGHVEALKNAEFYVSTGEIVAMIGPNGAGKSTALKAVFGLVELKGGSITFEGADVSNLRPDERVARGISLVPENRRIFSSMTVIENLEMGCFLRKDADTKTEIEKIFELLPALRERRNLKAGVLSTGEQQMLSMGRALIQKPKLLLADEPSAGLSPSYVDIIFDKLVEISKQGISVLLVEQNARMALEIANRGYVFTVGSIAKETQGHEMFEDDEVMRLLLGR